MGIQVKLVGLALVLTACSVTAAETTSTVIERGPHHRKWMHVTSNTTPDGKTVLTTNRYTELAQGMHYRQNGEWVETSETIEIAPGGAMASQGPHQVGFAANINTLGAINVLAPDGQRLRSHVLGLAYTDAKTGQSVLIAGIKDSIGTLVGQNQILYADAFDQTNGVRADVRYTYRSSGLEQDIIVRAVPPPSDFGLDEETVRLEVFTEFVEAPEPVIAEKVLARTPAAQRAGMALPDFVNQSLDFGEMHMDDGHAFPLSDKVDPADMLPTAKSWELLLGRKVLIEAVEFPAIKEHLEKLEKPSGRKEARNAPRPGQRSLPAPPKQARRQESVKRMAAAAPSEHGFVIDYNLVGSSETNFVFQADTTYYVNGVGSVFNLYGTTVIEGGTVVKLEPGATQLRFRDSVDCRTSPYRPAIFTSKNDNTIGTVITNSTGNPSTNYCGYMIYLGGGTGNAFNLHDLRVRHAERAFYGDPNVKADISHCQVSHTLYAFKNDRAVWNLRNLLVHQAQFAFDGVTPHTNNAEHITFHTVSNFMVAGLSAVKLTNSLLIGVTNNVSWAGTGVQTNLSDAGIFQTVGAGAHYLATNSAYRDAGTTNINSALLADLRRRTTIPPVIIAPTNGYYGVSQTWTPLGWDTNALDLGYHYDPIDYAVSFIFLTNATIQVEPGTCIGVFNTTNAGYYGLAVGDNGKLRFNGRADSKITLTPCATVQEMANTNWNGAISALLRTLDAPGGSPELRFQFTDFTGIAGGTPLIVPTAAEPLWSFTDCQFHGGSLSSEGGVGRVALTNCLLNRCDTILEQFLQATNLFYNCTFHGGRLLVDIADTNLTQIRDTLFVSTDTATPSGLVSSHVGYFGADRLSPTNVSDKVLSTFAFEKGPLGYFYIPASSAVANAGSRSAADAGLYHHTVTTNQVPETNSMVDIGFHYVAVNASGLPLDSNGDGTPDYLSDTNRNGVVDGGEPPFTSIAVAITSAQQYDPPATVTLTASATVNNSVITLVEYYFGTTNLGSSVTPPYSVTWSNLPVGLYPVTARATAQAGIMATSAVVNISVNNAIFVVGSTNLPGTTVPEATDNMVLSRLRGNGIYPRVRRDTDATAAESTGKKLVVISRSANPANVGYKFTSNAVPLLTWNDDLYDDLGFVATSSNFGSTNSQSSLVILNTSNSMSTNLTGTVTVVNWATNFSWAIPNSNAVKIASLTTDTNKCVIFGYEADASMPALEAPARRVGFFFGKAAGVNVTNVGWNLFDAAVQWATNVNVVPYGTWLAPTYTNMLRGDTNLTLSAKAFDNDSGLRKVKFFHDGVRIGVANTIVGNTNSYVWSNAPGGTYFMSSKAVDNGGLVTASTQLVNLVIQSNVLFVVTNTTLNASEGVVSNRLSTNGFIVTVKTAASVATADAYGKSLVLISSTVKSSDVGEKFTKVSTPVMVWKKELFADLGMATSVGSTSLVLVAVNAPSPHGSLGGGLSGSVPVVTNASSMNWAVPGSNAIVVATLTNDSSKAAIFAYEKGDIMLGLSGVQLAAPARRVGFMLASDNANKLNANGWKLFDAAVTWAMEKPCYPAVDVMLVIDNSQSMTNRALPDVKAAANGLLNLLNLSTDKVGVVYFATTATTAHHLSQSSASVGASIDGLQLSATGGTRIDLGISNALVELTSSNHNANAQRIMVLMSDGIPTDNSSNNTLALAATARDAGVRIFTVGFGQAQAMLMTALASTPTDYFAAPDSDDLLDLYHAVADNLCRLAGPPSVSIVSPATNAVFYLPANIQIEASAKDNDGQVTNVAFYSGTNFLGAAIPPSFSTVWTNPPDGVYSLSAVATDNLGLKATSAPVSITVFDFPTVKILLPTNPASVLLSPTNISITATATSTVSAISYVQFFSGPNSIGLRLNAPFTNNWRPVFGGQYTLTAKAVNTSGRTNTSESIIVTVNDAPDVHLNSPTNGTVFAIPQTNISLIAVATDTNIEVASVEFFAGTNSLGLGTFTNSVYGLVWSNVPPGSYRLYARATDNFGARASSDAVIITVQPTNSPPFAFAGSDQIVRLAADGHVEVRLSGIVTDDGLPSGALISSWEESGPAPVSYSPSSDSAVTVASFTNAGNYVLHLNATDSQFAVSDSVNITVLLANAAPIVNAGTDQSYVLPAADRYSTNLSAKFTAVYSNAPALIIGVDYVSSADALVLTHYQSNNLVFLSLNSVIAPLFTLAEWQETYAEIMPLTARSSSVGWHAGDTFIGFTNAGTIIRVEPDGTVTSPWVTLTNGIHAENVPFRGAMCVDNTGIWGGDIIAVSRTGNLWRINANRQATWVATVINSNGQPAYLHSVITVPNEPQRYGPFAGKAVATSIHPSVDASFPNDPHAYLVETNGSWTRLDLGFHTNWVAKIDFIPAFENCFVSRGRDIYAASYADFLPYIGDIVVFSESDSFSTRLLWTGTSFTNIVLGDGLARVLEGGTFAPMGFPAMPAPPRLHLHGIVNDDDLPTPVVHTTWETTSGSSPLFLGPTNEFDATVQITSPGIYVFRLTADDGELSTSDEVTITVTQNQAPFAYAGTNQSITATQAMLHGVASDDGWPSNTFTTTWGLAASAPGTVKFANSNSLDTVVSFGATGVYRLLLTAFDGQARAFSEVAVTVTSTNSTSLNTNTASAAELAVLRNGGSVSNYATLDFGITAVGTPVRQTLTISNWGMAPLHLLQLSNTGDFLVTGNFTSAIPTNASIDLEVQFKATNYGSLSSWFWIVSDDGTNGGIQNPFFLNLVAVANATGAPPVVSIVAPSDGGTVGVPGSIPLVATASSPISTIHKVEFYSTGTISGRIGQATGNNGTYSLNWGQVPAGNYTLSAVATDVAGRSTKSSPVSFTVRSNSPPTAQDDTFPILVNSSGNLFNVLANDSDPDGDEITIASFFSTGIGTATIVNNGKRIHYIPPLNTEGYDNFGYVISDQLGRVAGGWVTVNLVRPAPPALALSIGPDSGSYTGGTLLTLAPTNYSAQGTISRVEFYAGSRLIGISTAEPWSYQWPAVAGVTKVAAVMYDTLGQFGVATNMIIVSTNTGGPPIASFSNLTNPVSLTNPITVVREGLFELRGSAYDTNGYVPSYKLRLNRADGSLLRELTPQWIAKSVTNGPLFTNDFTMLRNDVYQLELIVSAGGRETVTNVTFALESELKVGQFSFSQQDMVIPVAGLPLSVIRTYSTLNPNSGDFGNSWTYAIHDLEVTIAEDRVDVEDVFPNGQDTHVVNIRSGGGRDVTLTLPDGRRTTFAFYMESGPCNEGDAADFCAFAKWIAPPDVQATLTPIGPSHVVALGPLLFTGADASIPFENFDFPGFILTTKDGTQYRIDREDLGEVWFLTELGGDVTHAYGQGKLTKITDRSTNTITILPGSITHKNAAGQTTRSVTFQRDPATGRITGIVDPNSTTNVPAVKYEYDFFGNLVRVLKLTDRATASYETNTYVYGNPNFPSYITEIRDGRGLAPLRTLYDDAGRMVGTVDAFGFTNRVVHGISSNLANNFEVVWDRSGHATTHYFDPRGNVTASIDALGKATYRTYDGTNNLTSMTDALTNTTFYAYDAAGNRTKVVDALLRTNSFSYDTNGNLLMQSDPLGNVTSNRYDGAGLLTNSTHLDAQRNVVDRTSYFYAGGQLVETRNFTNQVVSAFGYDTTGNLTNSAGANGFNRGFRYDANGNQTDSFYVWAGPGGNVTVSTLTTFDASGRVTQTIDANGHTNRAFYNAIGKVAYSIDKFGNTNSFQYDARGNLIETKYPDGTVTRTVYDAEARPMLTTDRNGVTGTKVTYDDVGRVLTSVRLKNVAVGLVADASNAGQWVSVITTAGTALSTNATDYWDNGWVKARTGPEGGRTSYEYWADGQVRTVTDPFTNVTFYSYDEAGRHKLVGDALNRTNRFEYDALGRMIKTIFPDATYSSNAFNALGQRVGQIDQAGLQTTFDYTLAGQLKSVTKPPVTNPTNAAQTITPTWSYEYDTYGRLSVMTDPKGRTNTLAYDAVGRQLTRRLPMGQTETNLYNALGQLWKKVDFKGQTNEFVYDKFGRVRAKFYFNAGSAYPSNAVCYQYNVLGQLAKIVERSGADASTNACDGYAAMVGFGGGEDQPVWATLIRVAGRYGSPLLALGLLVLAWVRTPREVKRRLGDFYLRGGWRLADIPVPEVRRLRLPSLWWRFVTVVALVALIGSDPQFSNLFEARAQCVFPANVSTETTRITEFSYDFDGRLAQVNSPEGVINYGYDLATGRHTSTCTTNSEVAYGYDELGRLKTVTALKRNGVTLATPEVTTYTYTKVGSRETVTLPNGVVSTWRYDNLNRLTNLTHQIGTTNLASYSYQLHPTGRRTSAIEVLKQEDGSYLTNTLGWQYDGMYRLTNEVSASSLTAGTFSTLYQYDEVGNRLKKIRQAGSNETVDYSYNNNDQLLQEVSTLNGTINYAYDANGSLTGKTNGSGTVTYDYNLLNKMRAVTAGGVTTSFLYNDSGIRVRSTTGGSATHYLIDANNQTGYAQVLEELTTPGTSPTRSYVIGDDVLAQCGTTATAPSYFLYDGHGSTRQLASTNATVTSRYNYDAYGTTLGSSSTTPETSLLYGGEQLDSTLGMYNLRARFYDAGNGRFNQRDSIRGNNGEPLSLHKYLYCHGDPSNNFDPSGNSVGSTVLEVVTVVGIILNVASLYHHQRAANQAAARGDTKGYVENQGWAMVDLAFLLVPGSGLIGPGGRLALASSRGTYASVQAAKSADKLIRYGVAGSSVWGYATTAAQAATELGDGSETSSGSGSGSDGGGEWKLEDQSSWPAEAQAYQWQITGRSGQQYVKNGVSFDGWDGARRVLLEAKYGYRFQLDEWAQKIDFPSKWRDWAQGRVQAAGGTPVEAHFSVKEVADMVREAVEGLGIKVIHTPATTIVH